MPMLLVLLLTADGGTTSSPCSVDTDCEPGWVCATRSVPGRDRVMVCTPGCRAEHPRCPPQTVCAQWAGAAWSRCQDPKTGGFIAPQ